MKNDAKSSDNRNKIGGGKEKKSFVFSQKKMQKLQLKYLLWRNKRVKKMVK